MTQILTKIKIKHERGAEIAYTMDLDIIKQLGLQPDKEFKEVTELNIGTVLTFSDGKKMKITKISTWFYDPTQEIDERYGINIYGVGKNYPYNFEIIYHVGDLD